MTATNKLSKPSHSIKAMSRSMSTLNQRLEKGLLDHLRLNKTESKGSILSPLAQYKKVR